MKDKSLPEEVKLGEYTHFVLPSFITSSRLSGSYANDFMEYWPRLDDIHKERRLLAGFMCNLRITNDNFKQMKADYEKLQADSEELQAESFEILQANGILFDPELLKNPALGYIGRFQLDFTAISEILTECATDSIWITRRLFIEEQRQSRKLLYVIKQFLLATENDTVPKRMKLLKEFFDVPIKHGSARVKPVELSDMVCVLTGNTIVGIFYGIKVLVNGWLATSRTTDMETDKARSRYLAKLKVAIPHWRPEDRAYLLEAVKSNGDSCKGTYVHKLIKAVGLEQFKKIAFGKEKFCATCTQSSFTATTQLLACKHCDREGIRPRARYCNTDCQRGHWIKHKAEYHACYNCGCLPTPDQGRLRACMRCIDEKNPIPARYCGVTCQKADWKKHRANAHAGPKEA